MLELQDTDISIRKLQHQLERLPQQQQLDAAIARIEDLQRQHDEVVVGLEQARAEQRQLERETDILTERRDSEQVRLYDGTVTNQREMRSIEAEIEATIRRISEHEELLFSSLETVDQLETREAELASELAAERTNVEQLTDERDEAAGSLLVEIAELDVVRDRQASELPDDLRARYDQVAQRTGGVAVGRLDGQACTACRVEMSMADIGDLLAGPALTTCPQCRRLLVVPE
ncbi:MAG: hypothetical protein WD576_04025, partial [Nitriliruptoraceae bacterium]